MLSNGTKMPLLTLPMDLVKEIFRFVDLPTLVHLERELSIARDQAHQYRYEADFAGRYNFAGAHPGYKISPWLLKDSGKCTCEWMYVSMCDQTNKHKHKYK